MLQWAVSVLKSSSVENDLLLILTLCNQCPTVYSYCKAISFVDNGIAVPCGWYAAHGQPLVIDGIILLDIHTLLNVTRSPE